MPYGVPEPARFLLAEAGVTVTCLSAAAVADLTGVAVPAYSRDRNAAGIVHFGVGAFHRSHEAMFVDRILRADPAARWGICGVLHQQDGLYTLVAKHPDGNAEARVIGSIVDYIFAPDDPEAVIEKLAAPDIRIVSLTVTEGGYAVNNDTGQFDADAPDIAVDLLDGAVPSTVFGLITEGLRRRRDRGIPALTVMSCDNIQGNGNVARGDRVLRTVDPRGSVRPRSAAVRDGRRAGRRRHRGIRNHEVAAAEGLRLGLALN